MDVPNSAAPEVAASTIKERNLVPVMGSWCFRSMSRPWLGPALIHGASRYNTMTPSRDVYINICIVSNAASALTRSTRFTWMRRVSSTRRTW